MPSAKAGECKATGSVLLFKFNNFMLFLLICILLYSAGCVAEASLSSRVALLTLGINVDVETVFIFVLGSNKLNLLLVFLFKYKYK